MSTGTANNPPTGPGLPRKRTPSRKRLSVLRIFIFALALTSVACMEIIHAHQAAVRESLAYPVEGGQAFAINGGVAILVAFPMLGMYCLAVLLLLCAINHSWRELYWFPSPLSLVLLGSIALPVMRGLFAIIFL